MAPHTSEWGWCDWWAIGGRYTGRLMLKPGAEGKVYGDAIPWFEAVVGHNLSDALPSTTVSRPMEAAGNGVDQARLRDLEDIGAPPAVIVGGLVHEPDADEAEAWRKELEAKTGRPRAEIMPRWVQCVNELLASADPDELVTLVDVHW